MSELVIHHDAPMPLPAPQVPVSVRVATMDDLPFMDGLQKQYSKQLGFFPRAQMEGYISRGWVLVAENPSNGTCLGYCASRDRYQKRDELGAIFQLCVAPQAQRKFVGAALLREVFDRAPYGCKLYCCWCAQDIAANHFWESMGFVPLAFRAGSEKKSRVHIFWQKRIRQGDTTTPWWFPSQTGGGSIREDRLVLPIPPGTHWSDAKPLILPNADGGRAIEDKTTERRKPASRRKPAADVQSTQKLNKPCRLWFAPPKAAEPAKAAGPPKAAGPAVEKPQRKPKAKNDPRLIAAARELRDRWLEAVNADPTQILGSGKYEVGRVLPPPQPSRAGLASMAGLPREGARLLPAA
jgi:GNAT superfamily N-acetyltransferase